MNQFKIVKCQRMAFLDFLKMFAMFMVLWGHAIQHLQTDVCGKIYMYRFIYTFHLPLFMTIAGFFCISSMNLDTFTFLKKKGTQLLLPCIIWSIILYGIIWFMNTLLDASLSYNPFFVFFKHFWFLKSLFVCYVIAYIGFRVTNKLSNFIILTILIAHISTTHQIPIMYLCFLSGFLLRIHFNDFITHYKIITFISFIIFISILIISTGKLPPNGINFIDLIRFHTIAPPLIIYYEKILISISASIFFIGFMYGLSQKLSVKIFLQKSYLTKIGKHTLGIYILQSIILETILAEYIKIDTWRGIFSNLNFDIYIVFPIISFIIVLLCTQISILIQRNKILNFLLLGNM